MELQDSNYSQKSPYNPQTTVPIPRQDEIDNDSDVDVTPLRSSTRKPRPTSVIGTKKRESFAKSIRAISLEKPPIKDPVGYTTSVLGLCCAIPAAGCGICCCVFLIMFLNLIPISMIVVGALYFNRELYCPADNIALILVIGGSINLVQGMAESILRFVGLWKSRNANIEYTTHNHPAIQIMNMILRLTAFGWLIAASVIIYRIYPQVTFENTVEPDLYCHPVLYGFGFCVVTVTLVFIGLAFALLSFSCCCILCIKS